MGGYKLDLERHKEVFFGKEKRRGRGGEKAIGVQGLRGLD